MGFSMSRYHLWWHVSNQSLRWMNTSFNAWSNLDSGRVLEKRKDLCKQCSQKNVSLRLQIEINGNNITQNPKIFQKFIGAENSRMEMESLDKTFTKDFTVIEPIHCIHEVKWTPRRTKPDCDTRNKCWLCLPVDTFLYICLRSGINHIQQLKIWKSFKTLEMMRWNPRLTIIGSKRLPSNSKWTKVEERGAILKINFVWVNPITNLFSAELLIQLRDHG